VLLRLRSVATGYSKRQVLVSIDLDVAHGEIVALIGHNGAGKSTLLKTIFGLVPIWKGQLFLAGEHLTQPSPANMLTRGVGFVPQGNRVFAELKVHENLEIGATILTEPSDRAGKIRSVLGIFPELRPLLPRRAGDLSGGEKQMLALATSFLLSPQMMLLDEPSLGLAPALVSRAFDRIVTLNKESGMAILIAEQKVRRVLTIAHRVYALRNGEIVFAGPTKDLDSQQLRDAYL